MRTMKTWQNFGGNAGTATTHWNYDLYRGWLASKDYPDASTGQPPAQEGTGGPTYTYTAAAGMVTTQAYDKLNRLSVIPSKAYRAAATNLPTSFAYQYNAANQRTRARLGDGSFRVYKYDALGQVVSGCRFWADGSPVAALDFTYAFDDIGHRTTTGGRASAASTYAANRLNQYSNRTVAPYVDVLGIANPTTDVTVNGNVANRKGGATGDFRSGV
jgi:YD repeat-containing protein